MFREHSTAQIKPSIVALNPRAAAREQRQPPRGDPSQALERASRALHQRAHVAVARKRPPAPLDAVSQLDRDAHRARRAVAASFRALNSTHGSHVFASRAAVSHPHRAPHSHASHLHASFAHGSRPRSLANARFAAATSDMDGASAHTDDARHGRERELHERRRRRGDGETTRGVRPAARTGERGARARARRSARTDAIALTWR